MKKTLFVILAIITTNLFSQPNIAWETNLGGSDYDKAQSILQTADDGYIIAGVSRSIDGDVGGNNGQRDYWIVKLNSSGTLIWEANLGGSNDDWAYSIQQTTDGGYIVAGESNSNNGDVGGNNGSSDFWIVKLDASGTLIWETNLGGSNTDEAYSIQQTTDGGYIVTGNSNSNDGDVSENNGGYDYWIVKLDASGTLIWETSLGGSDNDLANSIQQTTDGGYIIAGWSGSTNGNVGGNNGGFDYWIVKLDANGTLIWETNLGGSNDDFAFSIQQTMDSGFIVAGVSNSINGDVGGNNGTNDYWIVKLNSSGTLIWETNLGGSDFDDAHSIYQTTDGGYIVAGNSFSNDGDVGGNNGSFDYWIVKLDVNGVLVWETNLGGSDGDWPTSILQTSNGGYIVAGGSTSNDGDIGENIGGYDYWIVKLDADLSVGDYLIGSDITLYPNPTAKTFTIANISEEISKVEILDMQGKIIIATPKIHNNIVDISKLQSAMYIVKVYTSATVYTQQIIKK